MPREQLAQRLHRDDLPGFSIGIVHAGHLNPGIPADQLVDRATGPGT
jgi:hypothetical protein